MKKKVLITGINGFVGGHMAEFLLAQTEYQIFGLKRVNSNLRNIQHLKEKVRLIDGDLNDMTSLIKVIKESKPDQIYHFGALSWVTPSWHQPTAYMQTNAIGTINLFEALRVTECHPRILISCTPEEYGNVPSHLIPITEETPLHPINPYAASKVAQDMVCLSYEASYNFDIVRTRAFNHEGPRRDIHGANASFAYQIACIEKKNETPIIKVGNLEAKRNFTDVRDTVRAYYEVMHKGIKGEMYLIGTQEIYTMKECLEMLISMSERKNDITYEVEEKRVRPTELKTFIGDFRKIEELCHWRPQFTFKETMSEVLNYWRYMISQNLY